MLAGTKKLSFQTFDERAVVRIYRHDFLPHLRQTGCTYFVTFRLADSIPEGVLREWRSHRRRWLDARGIDQRSEGWRQQFGLLADIEKRTYERIHAKQLFEELDKFHGSNCLNEKAVADELESSIRFFDGSRFLLGDFVIMSNHVHLLMTPLQGFELEDVLHSIKSYSSNKINRILSRAGSLWMKESYDRLVRDGEELLRTQDYIRANPVKAGLRDGEFVLHQAEYGVEC